MTYALTDSQNPGVHLIRYENLIDLEDPEYVIFVFENRHEAQVVLNELSVTVTACGMRFAPTKCKVMPNTDSTFWAQQSSVGDRKPLHLPG